MTVLLVLVHATHLKCVWSKTIKAVEIAHLCNQVILIDSIHVDAVVRHHALVSVLACHVYWCIRLVVAIVYTHVHVVTRISMKHT